MAGRSQATTPIPTAPTSATLTSAAALERAGQVARPVTLAGQQVMAVPDPLRPLFPDGGLRRGSVVAITPTLGATSLALAMVAPAARAGSWVAVAGLDGVGLGAASEAGVPLERLVVVPRVPAGRWATVVAALLDAVDVVIAVPAGGPGGGGADQRRLAARVRERGAVLVLLVDARSGAPVPADLRLVPGRGVWQGVGEGHGHLRARQVEVTASGRRAAARPRRVTVWLPAAGGGVAPVDTAPVVPITPVPVAPVSGGAVPAGRRADRVGRAHLGRLVP